MNKVNTTSLLQFSNVSFSYKKKKTVLSNISFNINYEKGNKGGHIVALMGESGSGKSTMLKLILGLEKKFNGEIITEYDNPVISYIPQEPVLFEHLTCLQNARYFENISNYKNRFDDKLFTRLTHILGLHEALRSKSVQELSGGQKQRLSILRALSVKSDFLLLDEPCTGLDADIKMKFLIQLRQLADELNLLIIYITHHHDEARIIADEVVYLLRNETENFVDQVVVGPIKEFIHKTPALQAAKVFHFPELNVLPIVRNGECIKIASQKFDNSEYLTFKNSSISFSKISGFKFDIIGRSTMLNQLKLKDSEVILLTNSHDINEQPFVNINGSCNLYDKNGSFSCQIELDNNIIKN